MHLFFFCININLNHIPSTRLALVFEPALAMIMVVEIFDVRSQNFASQFKTCGTYMFKYVLQSYTLHLSFSCDVSQKFFFYLAGRLIGLSILFASSFRQFLCCSHVFDKNLALFLFIMIINVTSYFHYAFINDLFGQIWLLKRSIKRFICLINYFC